MGSAIVITVFAVIAQACVGLVNDDLSFPEQVKCVAKGMETVMADPQRAVKQMHAVMADPTFQENAKRLAERTKAIQANPTFQEAVTANLNLHSTQLTSEVHDSIDNLLDTLVDKIFDRSRETPRFQDANLESSMLAKPSSALSISSSGVRGPTTFARPRPVVAPLIAKTYFARRVPVMSMRDKSTEASELDSLSSFDKKFPKPFAKPWKTKIDDFKRQAFASAVALSLALSPQAALADDQTTAAVSQTTAAVSRFLKVDKTGFVGGFASILEDRFDQVHDALQGAGLTENTYGITICLFTLLVRSIILPVTINQVRFSVGTQQLAPLRDQIKEAFPGNSKAEEQDRQRAIGQLYTVAKVNPLAGCFPSLIQIPVFISLYRTLSNLNAEGKLTEGFLWIPSLSGPIFQDSGPQWFQSIFTGNPILGWEDTAAYLTLPLLLIVAQSSSTALLKTPKDPEAEQTTQDALGETLITLLPFIVATFSLSVPAGLSLYWIVSNVLVTSITVGLKASIKKGELSPEVNKFMESVVQGKFKTLLYAAKTENLEKAKDLAAEGKNPNERDEEGRTPLHFAAGRESVDVIKVLIDAKANVDTVDPQGCTPLFYACGYGHTANVQALLDAGAQPIPNLKGQFPADAARINPENAMRNDTKIMAQLEMTGNKTLIQQQVKSMVSEQLAKAMPMQSMMNGMSPEMMKSMGPMLSSLGQNKELQQKMMEMQNDPEMKPIIEEIRRNPQAAMMKMWNDPKFMNKVNSIMGEAVAEMGITTPPPMQVPEHLQNEFPGMATNDKLQAEFPPMEVSDKLQDEFPPMKVGVPDNLKDEFPSMEVPTKAQEKSGAPTPHSALMYGPSILISLLLHLANS